ncbi:MAG: hypothetical protein M3R24_22440, partial [Chloroflexota bacterium]|nr:hypothetical protein [Chloroflexota bacterium]
MVDQPIVQGRLRRHTFSQTGARAPQGSLAIPRASLRSLTTPVRYVTGWFPLYHCRLANDQASPLALAASPLALA